jgi:hypothetical protein
MSDATLKVVEREGWSKSLPINKAIMKIGSSAFCDVQLSAPDISAVHLQVMAVPNLPSIRRVINIGSALEIRDHSGARAFERHATAEIHNGDEIQLGGYTLVFNLPQTSGQVLASRSIEASLDFQNPVLGLDKPLEGLLTVKNLESKKACQFQVTLAGLPDDCYSIDPVPLIYPGASEEVRVRLFHQTTYPEAGEQELVVTVAAPGSHAGETLVIRQNVWVTPVFDQAFEIADDRAVPEKAAVLARAPRAAAPISDPPATTASETHFAPQNPAPPARIQLPEDQLSADLKKQADSAPTVSPDPPPAPVELARAEETPSPQLPDSRNVARVKVVRNEVDEFWDQ